MESRNDSAGTFNRRSERVPEKTKYMYTRAGSGRWKMGGRGEEGPGVEGRGGGGGQSHGSNSNICAIHW